jgi:hypothetical protein
VSTTSRRHPVYCQAAADRCQADDVYLGNYPPGESVRCPICGRHTLAGLPDPLTQRPSTSVPWRAKGPRFTVR